MRLQRYLAMCGVASRRACEGIIADGRVSVNGRISRAMGQEVDENNDVVLLDGKPVRPESRMRYILLNKPQGVVCTLSDPEGRTNVRELIPDIEERIYPVGRLDYDTEGLLLLTNDGALMQKMTHPTHGVEKVYVAEVAGGLTEAHCRKIAAGIDLDDGYHTAPCKVQIIARENGRAMARVTITEGHNRIVRRMFAAVGCQVAHLKREKMGPLMLGHLKPGQWRHLSPSELEALEREM